MIFSYNWLQSFFKKKLPRPEKLAELLTMHSFEVSEVKKTGKDFILDIDVLPNRGSDCFSHLGIAREIATLTGLNYIGPSRAIKEDKESKVDDWILVEVKDKKACPRYLARVISDLKVGFSPKWLRERLENCGLRSINNVVDIANYVMLETGQPLHAFDLEKIEGENSQPKISNSKQSQNQKSKIKKLIVRFAKEGEGIITLDEEKYDLDENILVIADAKKPLAIAGIKGGKEAGVDLNTKTIVLEAANFNPRVIRRGSKRIDLKTDASWRFEHSLDPNLAEWAINRAAYLIQEIAGGKVAKGWVDIYSKKVFPKRIKLDLSYLEKLLGIKIPEKEIKKILKRLGFKQKTLEDHRPAYGTLRKGEILEVEVPTFRLDISLPEDLIEEIGRIYGYEKIPAQFPLASLVPPKRNLEIFWENIIKDILKEVGFSEVYNYSFVGREDKEIFKFKDKELIEVENPSSLSFQYLRPSLIPNLLRNVQRNQRFFGEIKIFELGKVFFKEQKVENKEEFCEKRMLTGVIISGVAEENKSLREKAFYEAKGIIDLLANKLGISKLWYDEYQPTPERSSFYIWHPKKCAEIKINHTEIGFLGEISQEITSQLKISNQVIVFDIDFENLSQLASEEHQYRPISPYPAATRDLAVLVPLTTRVEEVLNKIEVVGGSLIRDIDLFDIYEGEELPSGKKNFAFHIVYQAEDRTLTAKEIEEIQNRIIKALEEEPEWQVRK